MTRSNLFDVLKFAVAYVIAAVKLFLNLDDYDPFVMPIL